MGPCRQPNGRPDDPARCQPRRQPTIRFAVRARGCLSASTGPGKSGDKMASSRWTRLGASVLVSLLVSAGLTSTVLGASPIDPAPGPIGSATVTATATATPTIAPAAAAAPSTDTEPATASPASQPETRSAPALPYDRSPTAVNAAGAIPATTMYLISGTITGWTSVNGILVQAMTGSYGAGAYTSALGEYSFSVPAGSYTLLFRDQSARYLNGYYALGHTDNFTLSHSSATTLIIGSADVIVPNVQLGTGYHIAGT